MQLAAKKTVGRWWLILHILDTEETLTYFNWVGDVSMLTHKFGACLKLDGAFKKGDQTSNSTQIQMEHDSRRLEAWNGKKNKITYFRESPNCWQWRGRNPPRAADWQPNVVIMCSLKPFSLVGTGKDSRYADIFSSLSGLQPFASAPVR